MKDKKIDAEAPVISAALADQIAAATLDSIAEEMGCTRRELLARGVRLAGGAAALSVFAGACKTVNSQSGVLDTAGGAGAIPSSSFLADIKTVEAATPLVAPTDPGFPAAATARGQAVGGVIGKWLNQKPYEMFAELLSQDAGKLPVFRPAIGPVMIFRHPHVIAALEDVDNFTVDPYAREMRKGTEGEFNPAKPGHFILGTDNAGLYEPDARILRHVLSPKDVSTLRGIIRSSVNRLIKEAKAHRKNSIDIVQTIGRYVPVEIVERYLGVPSYTKDQTSFDGRSHGGDTFPLDPELTATFKFQYITQGTIPQPYDMYIWVRDAFRNIFNNVTRNAAFERDGVTATENLICYIHRVVKFTKEKALRGENVGETMLARLVKMQLAVESGSFNPTPLGFASLDEMKPLLTDARIRENVFGTVTGAVANPEEGTARIIDALLDFKDGKIQAVPGSTIDFNKLAELAKENAGEANLSTKNMDVLNRAALELLRIYPQGEVLLRKCVKDTTVGGVPISAALNGTIFVCHGSAMRDPTVVNNPLLADFSRDPAAKPYSTPGEPRTGEVPQSTIYLQHGYGRHKCLGRYASEMTMEECLRAVLLLNNISRGSNLQMDAVNLYAESLTVNFTE